ncbi:hypothetical protein CRUP_024399 [Coryphaenoides rupestris]|nr:hypothetical protein CRUP_024399 [Coryphaenoides rupestris]
MEVSKPNNNTFPSFGDLDDFLTKHNSNFVWLLVATILSCGWIIYLTYYNSRNIGLILTIIINRLYKDGYIHIDPKAETRLYVTVNGFEFHVYNRTSLYAQLQEIFGLEPTLITPTKDEEKFQAEERGTTLDRPPRLMGEGFVVMQSNDVDIYYYQDEPGLVPEEQDSGEPEVGVVGEKLQDLPPCRGLDIVCGKGTDFNYGPWADRQSST